MKITDWKEKGNKLDDGEKITDWEEKGNTLDDGEKKPLKVKKHEIYVFALFWFLLN